MGINMGLDLRFNSLDFTLGLVFDVQRKLRLSPCRRLKWIVYFVCFHVYSKTTGNCGVKYILEDIYVS